MANFLTNKGAALLLEAGFNIGPGFAASLKHMLVTGAYTPDRDHVHVSEASSAELVAAGYTGGYGGSGRLPFTTPSVVIDNANNRAYVTGATPVWPSLGTSEVVAYDLLIVEAGGADSASFIFAVIDVGVTLNGGDFDVTPGASLGFARINC